MTAQTAKDAARAQAKQKQQQAASGDPGGIMHYLDMVGQASDYILTHPISDLANGLSLLAGLVTGNGKEMGHSLVRMGGWTMTNPVASLRAWTARQLAAVSRSVFDLQAYLTKLIALTRRQVESELIAGLRREKHHRVLGDTRTGRHATLQVRALHHQIEREAASAYRQGYQGRIGAISRIADYLASHNPAVRGLLDRLVIIVLDLAAVDNPPVRLLAGFLIRHVIERLGLDRLGARAVSDLLSPLLDHPHPRDLPTVIGDVSARLGALEGQQAQFWADGGAEVEQAGKQWANITSPVVDIAIIAWLAQAAADPQRWARELTGAVEPVMTGAMDAMTAIIREGRN